MKVGDKETMTAVEWLVEQITDSTMPAREAIKQAKELEKQQIIDAWKNGYREFFDGSSTPEEYYNQTFKNTNK